MSKESRIKRSNYYTIHGWMITDLDLKGTKLLVYAIVYGFSQDDKSEYHGGIQYLCDFCGGISRPTVIAALKSLCEESLLIRNEATVNSVVYVSYTINPLMLPDFTTSKDSLQGVKKFYGGSKEILRGGSKDSLQGVVKNFNPIYKEDIKSTDIEDNSYYMGAFAQDTQKGAEKSHRFKAPTVEEVEAYCKERRNGIDAERFVDYYEMRGWKIGKTSMKDWKAAVRTWERNDKAKAEENPGAAHWDDLDEVLPG